MKKGITVSVIAIAIVIIFISISTATVIGTRTMKSATYEEYMSKLKRVEDAINLYQNKNNELPITGEIMSKEGAPTSFLEQIKQKDDENNKLYIIDMNKISVSNVSIGYGTVENNDIFLISENTNNLYYYKGMEYKSKMYYCFKR